MGKILVVDDNEQIRELVKDVVESWGHTVIAASEGRGCLDAVRHECPDIILLDVMLPGLSGYEVCKELKGSRLTRNISVIMMTALSDIEDRTHGFKVGADNFLVKPINYEELQAIINKLLREKVSGDTMEPRAGVVKALYKTMAAIGNERYLDLITTECLYALKLADNLSLSEEATERLEAAIMLQYFGAIAVTDETEGKEATLSLLQDLKLGKWLQPVLTYTVKAAKGEDCTAEKEVIALAGMGVEADILLIVNRFALILAERQNNVNVALSLLKREGTLKNYNLEILKRLEQIINDEKILSQIK